MFRTVRKLLLVIFLAGCAAASLVLWLSADPWYEAHEWLGGSRYWRYDSMIEEIARRRGLDPMLIKAIVWRESGFRADKVGTSGERGLMQVSEAAARDWAKMEKAETFVPSDLFDPRTNLEVGIWYFDKAFVHWNGRDSALPFALAQYNAGKTRVDRWVAATNMGDKATAEDLIGAIDIGSTRRYIEDILERLRFYQERGRM